jgi:hypothetical protein
MIFLKKLAKINKKAKDKTAENQARKVKSIVLKVERGSLPGFGV